MKNTAREKGCTFVDISDLFADECNRSYLGAVVYRSDVRAYSLTYDDIAEKACTLTISFSVGGKTVTSTILPDSYSIDAESKTVTWEGHEYVISNADVASHPGDRGFERIAERIIDAI